MDDARAVRDFRCAYSSLVHYGSDDWCDNSWKNYTKGKKASSFYCLWLWDRWSFYYDYLVLVVPVAWQGNLWLCCWAVMCSLAKNDTGLHSTQVCFTMCRVFQSCLGIWSLCRPLHRIFASFCCNYASRSADGGLNLEIHLCRSYSNVRSPSTWVLYLSYDRRTNILPATE